MVATVSSRYINGPLPYVGCHITKLKMSASLNKTFPSSFFLLFFYCINFVIYTRTLIRFRGARCSSVVRAFVHGAMGRRIDPSWWTHWAISRFQPVLHDWCNKGCGMCYPVCVMVHIKEPLLLIRKSSPCGPLPYVRPHITVNKMCWVRC